MMRQTRGRDFGRGVGLAVAGALALGLAACGNGGGDYERPEMAYEEYDSAAPAPAPPMAEPIVVSGARKGLITAQAIGSFDEGGEPGGSGEAAVARLIAYSYSMGLKLPQAQVEPLMQSHVEACQQAGPSVCIVLGSSVNKYNEDQTNASLSIRARPDWIDAFQASIGEQADKAGGQITYSNKNSDDLTRAILDTDARLAAQVQLRDRLMSLMNRPGAELGDLIQVERELARVNGDIESMTANLKAMRLRVSMSSLDISYETKTSPVAPSRFNPLGHALGNFFSNVAEALASVINAFAFGLPWMLLIGVFIFIWLRLIWPWVRKRRKDKKVEKAA